MRLYEILTGVKNMKGRIWCTDGSFVDPGKFSESDKAAYGYALNSTTVVSLIRSRNLYWAKGNSSWYNTKFTGSQSKTDGASNSNYLKSQNGFGPDLCPAVHCACTQVNAGITSYMPSRDELSALYESIMKGNMKEDLKTAGLYECCNYRRPSSINTEGWRWIWSSSQDLNYSSGVWGVDCDGRQSSYYKGGNCSVISFFKIEEI